MNKLNAIDEISVRDATVEDADFAEFVIRKVMTVYVEQTWKMPHEREAWFESNSFDLKKIKSFN